MERVIITCIAIDIKMEDPKSSQDRNKKIKNIPIQK